MKKDANERGDATKREEKLRGKIMEEKLGGREKRIVEGQKENRREE